MKKIILILSITASIFGFSQDKVASKKFDFKKMKLKSTPYI